MPTSRLRSPRLRPLRPALLALAGAAALAACGGGDGPTGPSGPLAARLSGPAQVAAAPNGGRTRCDDAVTLSVQGAGAEPATLDGLRLDWRDANGQPVPGYEPDRISAAELAQSSWFGAGAFRSGERRAAERWVSTSPHQAFRFVHTLTYHVGAGAPQTATYTLVCH